MKQGTQIAMFTIGLLVFVFREDIRDVSKTLVQPLNQASQTETAAAPSDNGIEDSILGGTLCRYVETVGEWNAEEREKLRKGLVRVFLQNDIGDVRLRLRGTRKEVLYLTHISFSRQGAWDLAEKVSFQCLHDAGIKLLAFGQDRVARFGFLVEDRIDNPDSIPLESSETRTQIGKLIDDPYADS